MESVMIPSLNYEEASRVKAGDTLTALRGGPTSHFGLKGEVIAIDSGGPGVIYFRLRFPSFLNYWWRHDEVGRA